MQQQGNLLIISLLFYYRSGKELVFDIDTNKFCIKTEQHQEKITNFVFSFRHVLAGWNHKTVTFPSYLNT